MQWGLLSSGCLHSVHDSVPNNCLLCLPCRIFQLNGGVRPLFLFSVSPLRPFFRFVRCKLHRAKATTTVALKSMLNKGDDGDGGRTGTMRPTVQTNLLYGFLVGISLAEAPIAWFVVFSPLFFPVSSISPTYFPVVAWPKVKMGCITLKLRTTFQRGYAEAITNKSGM